MTTSWNNWSGSQQHQACRLEYPCNESDIAESLEAAASEGRQVRAIGSAHSFVPFWTDDFLVSLDNMRGLISCDEDKCQCQCRSIGLFFVVLAMDCADDTDYSPRSHEGHEELFTAKARSARR